MAYKCLACGFKDIGTPNECYECHSPKIVAAIDEVQTTQCVILRGKEDLLNINIKRRAYGQPEIIRFKKCLQKMSDAHPVGNDRQQFIRDMENNFILFWVFYTIAKHFHGEKHQHYSHMTILGYMRNHTSVSGDVRDGFKLNNKIAKYLAELVCIRDSRFVSFFEFREPQQKELENTEDQASETLAFKERKKEPVEKLFKKRENPDENLSKEISTLFPLQKIYND